MSAAMARSALGDELRSRASSVLAVADHHTVATRVRDLRRCLADDERQLYHGVLAASRRAEFLVGRAVLRACVASVLGIHPRRVPLRAAPSGKPTVDHPRPGLSLHVSVSHCDSLLLVGLSRVAPIGVDAEDAARSADGVVRRFFHPRERDALAALPAGERARAFRRIWAVKEACAKAADARLFELLPAFVGFGEHGTLGEVSWRVLSETERAAVAVAVRTPAPEEAFPEGVIEAGGEELSALLGEVLDD